MTPRVLIVDDEPALLDAVSYSLRQAGFETETSASGEAALDAFAKRPFDVVVLDVRLPGRSGFDVCQEMRRTSDVPIVMLTARDGEADRVAGLDLGADDYVTKPFSNRELVSRLRAILRRRELDLPAAPATVVRVGSLVIDRLSREVALLGRAVALTPSEYEILLLLATSPGAPVSRHRIVTTLWNSDYVGDARVCDVHIHALRRKFESGGADPGAIATVRGVGYQLDATLLQ